MLVLTKEQYSKVVAQETNEQLLQKQSTLLDIVSIFLYNNDIILKGSGDGNTLDYYRGFYTEVFCTEISTVMCNILKKKGYVTIQTGDLDCSELQKKQFDVIHCFNVLDRCDKPRTLLKQMYQLLKKGGKLVIALVLPFEPFVENGQEQLIPSETFASLNPDQSFEISTELLIETELSPLNFEVTAISRVPYFCEGDIHQDYYYLNDLILILTK